MTDNQTTELRKLLTERGVDWLDESNGYANVTTFMENGVKWTVISKSYLNPEHDWMTLRAEHITPEQAVAATVGNGMCRNQWQWDSGFCCSECFYTVSFVGYFVNKEFRYCPNCRKAVAR